MGPAETQGESMLAALAWQVELGADEAIGDMPLDRYEAPAERRAARRAASATTRAPIPATAATAAPETEAADPVAEAKRMAAAAGDPDSLREKIAAYRHCDLRKGARNLVFADGNPEARLMIVGEAPGRDEDREGRPFVGRAGQLLDRMLAAIGRARTAQDPDKAVYITNVLPWRPPQNRDPTPEEMAMMQPFLLRHVELVAPALVIAMGNIACQTLIAQRGITRLRGKWALFGALPVMPMFHPAYLLRNPIAKRESWVDLLETNDRLKSTAERTAESTEEG